MRLAVAAIYLANLEIGDSGNFCQLQRPGISGRVTLTCTLNLRRSPIGIMAMERLRRSVIKVHLVQVGRYYSIVIRVPGISHGAGPAKEGLNHRK